MEDGGTLWHGIISDITERKQREEVLLNLRTAVEQSANTIVITDIRGNIEYVNPAFEKNTVYTAAEAAGNNPRILKSGEQDAEFYRHLWATITAGKTWRGELNNKRKDGSLNWELATISPVQNDKGETVRYLAIKEDITERKAMEMAPASTRDRLLLATKAGGVGIWDWDITEIARTEKELKIALERAEAANRAKSEFLGVMSHELRTPLNGVLGFAQLLSDALPDSEQKDYAETIRKSGEHLLAIVSDILDFTSIDAGTLAIHVAPLAVADLVNSAEDIVRKSAADKGLELRCELAGDVPEQIAGDELRMSQILVNLLGNAVKFTASGSVSLRVTRSGQGAWASPPCEAQGSAAMPVSKPVGRPFSLEEERPPTAPGGCRRSCADHRSHRKCDARRPGAMPRRRHGRVPLQAVQKGRAGCETRQRFSAIIPKASPQAPLFTTAPHSEVSSILASSSPLCGIPSR